MSDVYRHKLNMNPQRRTVSDPMMGKLVVAVTLADFEEVYFHTSNQLNRLVSDLVSHQ